MFALHCRSVYRSELAVLDEMGLIMRAITLPSPHGCNILNSTLMDLSAAGCVTQLFCSVSVSQRFSKMTQAIYTLQWEWYGADSTYNI